MRVDLDGLVFNREGYLPDDDGIHWLLTGLDGWDSPEARQTVTEPTSRHGSVIAKALLQPRAMTMKGIVKAPSLEQYYAAKQTLQGQTNNIFAPKPMTVTEDIDRVVGVVRAGGLRMKEAGMCAFEFELPLTCPDPLKYAVNPVTTTLNAGQTKTVTNDGTFISERWTMRALAEGNLKVENQTWGAALVTDQEVEQNAVFDCLARTVTSPGGRPIYSSLAPMSVWWALQPGQNTISNTGPTGVSLAHYPAWL